MTIPQLRNYQTAGEVATAAALAKGTNRVLLKYPTGTGKTVMFADFPIYFREWIEAQGKRHGAFMLVIAHREELLDQAADKIRRQNPKLIVDIEQGPRYASRYSDVIIASIQTLSALKYTRLKRLLRDHTFRIVIVDEAHHAAAASYRTTLAHLGFLPMADATDKEDVEAATHDDVLEMEKALKGWDAICPKDRLLVGVTATPNRTDAIGLGCVFQHIAYSYGLKQAIDDKWLVPIKPWVIETSTSLDDVRTTAGEFNQKDLGETVNTPYRNKLALDAWKMYAKEESTIAFTVDVQHAHDAAALFAADGIRAVALSGKTPKDERRQILEDYTRGEIQVVMNCMVLTEGTDLPRTGCILHMKPTKSATLYEQMTGRGLRIHPGKTQCVVIDLVDVARRHSLQVAPVLYGLPPGIKTKGEDLNKLVDEFEKMKGVGFDAVAELQKGRFSLQELLDRASTFDIWKIPSLGDFGTGRRVNWIKMGDADYRVRYPWADGDETLQVSQDMLGQWEVVQTLKPKSIKQENGQWLNFPSRQRTLVAGVATANEAAVFAETFIADERPSVMKLKDKTAYWRRNPASEKQLNVLRYKRIPIKPGMTMGEASDLLDLANARKSFRGRA